MATKLGRMITYLIGVLPIKSHGTLIMRTSEITFQKKTTISTVRMPMATKLGRMVTYLNGLAPMKSHHPLIT